MRPARGCCQGRETSHSGNAEGRGSAITARTPGWGPAVAQAGKPELKSRDWLPGLSCHRIWEGRIRCLAGDLVVPSPPPASGTAGDLSQPDAPSGTLLGQARAHTPLSSLALPLASLSPDHPLDRSIARSLALHRLPSGAALAPTCSEAPSAPGRAPLSALTRRPDRRSPGRQRTLGAAAATHPGPRSCSGSLDVRDSPLSPRTASGTW